MMTCENMWMSVTQPLKYIAFGNFPLDISVRTFTHRKFFSIQRNAWYTDVKSRGTKIDSNTPIRSISTDIISYTLHFFHDNYLNLALSSSSAPGPVNSCELHNYYLVLSFLLMYSSSGLSDSKV